MANVTGAPSTERVTEDARAVVEAGGVELVDVEVKGHPGSRLVRLVVDTDAGVDVDTCAELSRAVGAALDAADVVAGSYTLQVSSPGLDRPLRTPRDFARNEGRRVRVLVIPGDDEQPPAEIVGAVLGVDDEQVRLDVDGDEVAVALEQVQHAKVVLPW